jgi:hypothetical protein
MALRNALTRASGPLRAFAAGSPAGGLIGLETGASGAFARLARRGAHGRNLVEDELYDRSRQEITLGNRTPSVAADAWIAPNATLVGDADVADQCSVWHGSVLKGDLGAVRLGAFSNVQEKCVIDAAGYATPSPPPPRVLLETRARGAIARPHPAAIAPAPPPPPPSPTIKNTRRKRRTSAAAQLCPHTAAVPPLRGRFSFSPLACRALTSSPFPPFLRPPLVVFSPQSRDSHRSVRHGGRGHVHLLRDRRG